MEVPLRRPSRFLLGALGVALALTGYDSGSDSAPSTTHAPSVEAAAPSLGAPVTNAAEASRSLGVALVDSASQLSGRVVGAEAGSVVFLVRSDASAHDLRALADTILDVTETDATGSYGFAAPAETGGLEVVVSAPGKALGRAPLGQEIVLEPEGRVEITALDASGQPVELAFALVLDAQGTPLPLPTAPLVSDEAGALQVTRLPSGRCEVIVASPDLQRIARLQVDVASGQTYQETLELVEDDELTRRFLVIAGGPEVAAAIGEETK
ncbi:MAG: hypothetical protein JKY65_09545 [Planctomycetes bacterium]|nr:hypothetical protein [Planctomycetota bacterium]